MDGLSKLSTLESAVLPTFYQRIRQENVLVQEVQFEYHRKNNTLMSRVEGITSLALTESYHTEMAKQYENLRKELLTPLIELVKHNFTMKFKVDSSGIILDDGIQIIFKMDCIHGNTLVEKFQSPFKVLLPFVEYIDYLSLRGREYELAVIEGEVTIDKIDLLDVIQKPIVGPTAKAQWLAFIVEAAEEAKKDYKLDVVIPVHDGEVTWEIPYSRRLQFREVFSK